MKRILNICLILVLIFCLTGCGFMSGTDATEETVYAPDLTLKTVDGNNIQLSDLKGKPIVLNFWASWCNPCKSEMPLFQQKYEELGDDVVFVMVCIADGTTETIESGKAFIQKNGYTFPVYFDTANQITSVYNVSAIPTTFFIDSQGLVLAYAPGMLMEESFDEGIRRIMPAVTE